GETFVTALEQAVGADVRASRSLVGAAKLGGSWEMSEHANKPRPPLTQDGMVYYGGVFTAGDLTLTGLIDGSGKSINTFYLVDTNNTPEASDDLIVGSFVLPATPDVASHFSITVTVPDITHTYLVYDSGFRLYGTLTAVADIDPVMAGD
ncbi:DUF4347 domain-containing protein, partial [Mesorhizobium sp. M2D.F.Ca.ET.145.01.1.1]